MVAIYQATAPTRCVALILFYLMSGTITVRGTGDEIYDLSTICWIGNGNEVRDIMDGDWTWYFYWSVYYRLH
jgi:hypothetical protein